ncbi:MAG: tyrosine-protein phosphatase [Bacteroides sp.]|nr:tyrosine-protein phosphatase [Bacteroides sp.]
MIRSLSVIACIMVMFVSCKTSVAEKQKIELKNQLIGLTNAHNARQLGGYRIGDQFIKKNLLLRSAKLSGLSKEDSILLGEKYKVQCIYDFRGKDESLSAPDVIPGKARYLSLALSFTGGERQFDVKFESEEQMIGMLLQYADHPSVQAMCTSMYDLIFFEESSKEVYRQFFADLLTTNPEEGAVLWHCTQGKDRAGCASAMLLAALGANRELIMADFILSKSYYDPMASQIKTETETQKIVINTLISANPEIFEATLDKVDAKYGSLRNYLTTCIGVTPEMMNVLRDRYLE